MKNHDFFADASAKVNYRWLRATFSVKTRQVTQMSLVEPFALQDDPSASRPMFYEVKSMVLGLQNALWRSKRVLAQLLHFGAQKACESIDQNIWEIGPGKIGEL